MNFLFSCPVCDTPLEATPADTGQSTTCPICGQAFPIPHFDHRSGRVIFDPDKTPRRPKESMAYLHAYASDGKMAPQVVHEKDGRIQIRCSRCLRINPAQANWCEGCRMPFTVESGGVTGPAVGGAAAKGGGTGWILGIIGLVMGLASIPCFTVVALAWLPGLASSSAAVGMCIREQAPPRVETVSAWGFVLCTACGMMDLVRMSV